jgi:glycosyltransferase involved in cell wall biosynthesis
MENDIRYRPVLSIVVPTRNRQQYAVFAINNILGIPSDAFELVIQDSSDSMELKDFVSRLKDPRLRYNYTHPPISGVDNFNIAAGLAKGEYICFLGDDDGVNPEIMEAVLWAKRNHIDALTPSLAAQYLWPDIRQKYYGSIFSGRLTIRPFTGAVCKHDAKMGLKNCLKNACQNLVDSVDLPKVYYGIVKKIYMDKVYEKTGKYFPGVSPDISAALAVACCVNHVWTIDYPLFVPGSSALSTAGASAKKSHVGRLQDQPHLPYGCWNNWSDIIPCFYSVQTIWAQSGVHSLEAMGHTDVFKEFNIPYLHALCIVFNPHYYVLTINSLIKALKITNRDLIKGILSFVFSCIYAWGLRAGSLTRRFVPTSKQPNIINISDLNNIEEAVDSLKKHLSVCGIVLNRYIQ